VAIVSTAEKHSCNQTAGVGHDSVQVFSKALNMPPKECMHYKATKNLSKMLWYRRTDALVLLWSRSRCLCIPTVIVKESVTSGLANHHARLGYARSPVGYHRKGPVLSHRSVPAPSKAGPPPEKPAPPLSLTWHGFSDPFSKRPQCCGSCGAGANTNHSCKPSPRGALSAMPHWLNQQAT
jgi:hypothetical protein